MSVKANYLIWPTSTYQIGPVAVQMLLSTVFGNEHVETASSTMTKDMMESPTLPGAKPFVGHSIPLKFRSVISVSDSPTIPTKKATVNLSLYAIGSIVI